MDFFNYVWQIIRLATVMDLLDIVIVTFVLYKIVHLIRGTTAARLLKGVALLLVVTQLADWMQLNVISFLLENTLNVGILAVVVLFQPELRKMFENVGRTSNRCSTGRRSLTRWSMPLCRSSTHARRCRGRARAL